MNKRIKVGIFGVGRFGSVHLNNLLEIPDVEVIGFCDTNKDRQSRIAKEYGIPLYNQSDLIEKADVLDIVTPTYAHYEIAMQAIEKGKHVFIEKPFTQTQNEAYHLRDAVKKTGVRASVGFIERFNPVFIELQNRCELAPNFIEIHRMGQFNPGRGTEIPVIHELMIHDLDMAQYLIKSKIRDIRASGTSVLSDEIDIVNARIEFENNAVANITCSRIEPMKMRKIRLFQKNKTISMDLLNHQAEIYEIKENVAHEKLDTAKIMSNIPSEFDRGIAFSKIETPLTLNPLIPYHYEKYVKKNT